MKAAKKAWTAALSLLLCLQIGQASPSTNLDFCLGCCTSVSILLRFNRGTAECCFRGCRNTAPGALCDSAIRTQMFEAGSTLFVNRGGRFGIADVNYACFEESPGDFDIFEATDEPTATQFPTGEPTPVEDGAVELNQVIVASSAVGAAAVFFVLGVILIRKRRRHKFGEGASGSALPLSALARKKYQNQRQSGNHGSTASAQESQVSYGSGRSKPRSKPPSQYASQGSESEFESETSELGDVKIVSMVDAEKSIRSGILSYRRGETDSFNSVSAKLFLNSVTRKEEKKFSQFKRLSTARSSKRESVYFTESTLLNTPFIVERVIAETNKLLKRSRDNDGFSGYVEPEITLRDYLVHLIEHLDEWYNSSFDSNSMRKPSGVNALFIAMIYQERLKSKIPTFNVTTYNVHRVFAVSMLIGAKFAEDDIITNKYWGAVARIQQSELNSIESTFCSALNFDLYVSPEEFKAYSEPFLPPSLKTAEKRRLYRYSI